MKNFLAPALSVSLVLSALAITGDARACGGCFIQQSESTQVQSHRMIFSVSKTATTLWDQIEYSGEPESFAWVLPIQGQVDIGLSSDALFARLDDLSRVEIYSPSLSCPPPTCQGTGSTFTATTSVTGSGGGVTVIAQETVGPYETVQLASSDPQALQAWLDGHGYQIPPDVAPVIDDYVLEGFDFLAMKLVPGAAVSAMQPIRITAPGAGLALPLRMVAAGTGATTPISLWIFGEGRYEPANFPWFTVNPDELVWDWDSQSSNYKQLRQAGFDATQGKGWLVEAALTFPPGVNIGDPLLNVAEWAPEESGYDADATKAVQLCTADLEALYGALPPDGVWMTRLHAELPRSALATDLQLGAAASQLQVSPAFYVTSSVGTPPACPPVPDCGTGGTGGGTGGGAGGAGGQDGGGSRGGGCAVDPSGAGSWGGAALPALALALVLGRRRRTVQARRLNPAEHRSGRPTGKHC